MSILRSVKKGVIVILKPGSRRFAVTRKIAEKIKLVKKMPNSAKYLEWIERTEPYGWSEIVKLDYKPKISIVVPVFNPPDKYFLPMVYSVVNQVYENWELLLVNASNIDKFRATTEDSVNIDTRIKVINLVKNKGIAENTNAGIEQATGDYIALLDHDDILAPQALYELVRLLQNGQLASIVYSDEDKISADGEERFDPHFKPDWSPLLLREVNYINHFSIIRRDIIGSIGGYRTGLDGAQDYDLYLRIVDIDSNVLHVPKVLYHWRAAETSTARNFDVKDNILHSGVKALSDHLTRNKITASVFPVIKQPGFYEVTYHIDKYEKNTVIIVPSVSKMQYKKLVDRLLNFNGNASVHFILGDMPENPDNHHDNIIEFVKSTDTVEFLKSAKKLIKTDNVVVVDSGLVPLKSNWINALVGPLKQDKTIAIVTPILLNSNKSTIYDAGLVSVGMDYINLFKGTGNDEHTIFGNSNWSRNLDSITGNCFATRKQYLDDIIDCYQNGQINAKLLHDKINKNKTQIFLNSFATMIFAGDSHRHEQITSLFTPNSISEREDYGLAKMINIPEKEAGDE